RRRLLDGRQGAVEGARRDPRELDGVQLLKAVERAGLDGLAQGREGAEGDQLASGPRHVDVLELLGREAAATLDLGDDLVAAPGDGEAIDEVAAEHGRQIEP